MNNNIETEIEYVDSTLNDLTIFLLDKNNYLAMKTIKTNEESNSIETKAKQILEYITIGSTKEDKIPNGFKPIIPADTKVLSLEYKDGPRAWPGLPGR